MSSIGLDLPGLNSTACRVGTDGMSEISASAAPLQPSSVLLPLIARERPVGGNAALRSARGIGMSWPPLAQSGVLDGKGWPQECRGRILVAECWSRLGKCLETREWSPPDGLPRQRELTPAQVIAWEAAAAAGRLEVKGEEVVLAIPNRLGEDGQQDLLDALRDPVHRLGRVRLLWRPVAALLSWCDEQDLIDGGAWDGATVLVIDAGVYGVEVTPLTLRLSSPVEGRCYLQPVRSAPEEMAGEEHPDEWKFWPGLAAQEIAAGLAVQEESAEITGFGRGAIDPASVEAGFLLSGFVLERMFAQPGDEGRVPVAFASAAHLPVWVTMKAARKKPERTLTELSAEVEKGALFRPTAPVLLIGPLAPLIADRLSPELRRRVRLLPAEAVAQGAALYGWRLARDLPTYLDILPSLHLFVLKGEDQEAGWKEIIPPGFEIAGGQTYNKTVSSAVSIGKGTDTLISILKRGGDTVFRKLTTKLPTVPERDTPLDLIVTASSAGGRAQIEMRPAKHPVFGPGRTVLLDWGSMKEEKANPKNRDWPTSYEPVYAYPDPGELLAHKEFFDQWIEAASNMVRAWNDGMIRFDVFLDELSRCAKRQIAVRSVLGDGAAASDQSAPVASLLTFGTRRPLRYLNTFSGSCVCEISMLQDEEAAKLGNSLWDIYMNVSKRRTQKKLLVILGRMGGYAPSRFVKELEKELNASSGLNHLFAAGRTFLTPESGATFFRRFAEKLVFMPGQVGKTNNWLRTMVYILYQSPDALSLVERPHIREVMDHARRVLLHEHRQENYGTRFHNALRCLALGLRFRRKVKTFLSPESDNHNENELRGLLEMELKEIENSIRKNPAMYTRRRGELTAKAGRILELVTLTHQWLTTTATTGILPPVDVTDEGEDDDGEDE